jgi:serine phosphatase RsbU (regulator of sigma subunit)
VARIRDWIDLGKGTLNSLKSSDMMGLYEREWPETRAMLTADHRHDIERDPRRFRRWIRSVSAILYGLAKRLAPHRRIVFALSWIYFFACLFGLFTRMKNPPFWTFVEIVATFLLVTVLLAMELIDKIRFRDELELARDLQAGLIPKVMPQTGGYDVAAFNRIANTVGGDIYDFVPLADGRLAVLFGDASGHGMAAGLVMAVAHASFRTQLDVDPSPASIIGSLNRILCRTGGSRSFFSACYLLLEPSGEYVMVVAGHPQIVHVGADGKVVQRLGRGAYPLGIKAGLAWDELRGNLAAGECLLLHSDGLTEARNAQDREFGDSYIDAIVGWHPQSGAAPLVESLVHEWQLFTGNRAPEDDVSVAVIARRPTPP